MNPHWAMIWHQAMTRSFLNGKAFGWNKTVAFTIQVPVSGTQLRLRLSNRFGSAPYEIGAVRVFSGGQPCPITLDGQQSFQIPVGGVTVSDPCALPVERGEALPIRLYYTNTILDNNMIEEGATILPGNQTENAGDLPQRKPLLARLLGAYNGIPALEAVVREVRQDGYYYAEGLHQGDHLHPNVKGGKMHADAFDLKQLTGKET